MEIVEDIKPTILYSAVAIGSFDKTKRALERRGYTGAFTTTLGCVG